MKRFLRFFPVLALAALPFSGVAQEAVGVSLPFAANEFHTKSSDGSIELELKNYPGTTENLKQLAAPYAHSMVLEKAECSNGNCKLKFTVSNPANVHFMARYFSVLPAAQVTFSDKVLSLQDFILLTQKIND